MVEENGKDQLRSTLDLHCVQKEDQLSQDGMRPLFVSLPGSGDYAAGGFFCRDLLSILCMPSKSLSPRAWTLVVYSLM